MFSRTQAAPPSTSVVDCPICAKHVRSVDINAHLDAGCATHLVEDGGGSAALRSSDPTNGTASPSSSPSLGTTRAGAVTASQPKRSAASFFQTPAAKRQQKAAEDAAQTNGGGARRRTPPPSLQQPAAAATFSLPISPGKKNGGGVKRRFDEGPGRSASPDAGRGADAGESGRPRGAGGQHNGGGGPGPEEPAPPTKRSRTNKAAPLAERMRPQTLDEVCGQDLVGPHGVLRALIEADRVPSMILWGGSGTGKTTIARCIAQRVGSRFVEMNATNSGGIAECKKLFQDAANELALTGRKTILFCDEIHRFSKAQQDVFLKPVEAGTITLIGATTENPSFRIVNALLSRCRTFTLAPLTREDVQRILARAVLLETGVAVGQGDAATAAASSEDGTASAPATSARTLSPIIDEELLSYLAAFSDGDARTALNLLDLALSIAARPRDGPGKANGASGTNGTVPLTKDELKAALTKTLVYDRAGDQHYDTISAFHKSVRGSDPDATLYYLARMLQSGEDPLFVARRMVVIASEDVGLADATLLPLATAAYTAAQQIGMPEARIPLAHCAVALALAPKSTRAYRGLNNAFAALREPGVASLPIPIHLRNAPTRLMKDLDYGKEYKYNPNYVDGRVKQDYLPEELLGRTFLEARDLGTAVDPDLEG